MPAPTNDMLVKLRADTTEERKIFDAYGRIASQIKNTGKTSKSQAELMKLALNRVNKSLKLQTQAIQGVVQAQSRQAQTTKQVVTNTKQATNATDRYSASSKQMRLVTHGMREALGRLRNQILVVVFAWHLLTRIIKPMITLATQQQFAERKLEAALKGSGLATKAQVSNLKALANQLQSTTMFGNEQIVNAQAMLATFKLNAEQIAKLTPRLLDMATSVSTLSGKEADLQAIAIALGKGVTGNTGVLARYGVVLSETAKKSKDFNLILKDLDENYRGIAEAMRTTYIGQVKMTANAYGDLAKQLGYVSTKSTVVIASMDILRRSLVMMTGDMERNRIATNNFSEAWMKIAISVIGVSAGFRGFFRAVKEGLRVLVLAFSKGLEVIIRLSEKLPWLKGKFDEFNDTLREFNKLMSEDLVAGGQSIIDIEKEIGDQVENLVNRMQELGQIDTEVFNGLKDIMDEVQDKTKETYNMMYEITQGTAKSMESAFSDLFFDAMTNDLKTFHDYFDAFTKDILRSLSQILAKMLIMKLIPGAYPATPILGFPTGHTGGEVQKKIPRFSRGGEVLANLEVGEGVVNRTGMANLGREGLERINRGEASGAKVIHIWNINTIDAKSFRQYLAENQDMFVNSVYGDIEGNYGLRKLFKGGI